MFSLRKIKRIRCAHARVKYREHWAYQHNAQVTKEALFTCTKYAVLSSKKCVDVFLAHLSHRLMVSYCHQPMSVVSRPSCVVRRPSCVVRRPSSTIASNDISSETSKPRALIFGM